MRDKTHDEFIEKWAKFVKTNPKWRKIHTKFINAQFEMHKQAMKKISKEKIIKIYKINNLKGYPILEEKEK